MFPFDDVIMDQNRPILALCEGTTCHDKLLRYLHAGSLLSRVDSPHKGSIMWNFWCFLSGLGTYDSSYYLYVLIAQIEIISRGNQGPTNIYIYILVLLHCPQLFSKLLPKSYTARVNLPMILIINTLLQLVQCMKVFMLGKPWGWRHIPSQLAWPHRWLVCSFENIYIKIV